MFMRMHVHVWANSYMQKEGIILLVLCWKAIYLYSPSQLRHRQRKKQMQMLHQQV